METRNRTPSMDSPRKPPNSTPAPPAPAPMLSRASSSKSSIAAGRNSSAAPTLLKRGSSSLLNPLASPIGKLKTGTSGSLAKIIRTDNLLQEATGQLQGTSLTAPPAMLSRAVSQPEVQGHPPALSQFRAASSISCLGASTSRTSRSTSNESMSSMEHGEGAGDE